MKVRDLLTTKGGKVATTPSDATIEAVLDRLKQEHIGALVVSDDGQSVNGIISERDIVRGLPEHGAALLDMTVRTLMTQDVKTCAPEASVEDVMGEMSRNRFRHMPVVAEGKLCGIVSIGDVVKNRLEELETEADSLRDFIVGRA